MRLLALIASTARPGNRNRLTSHPQRRWNDGCAGRLPRLCEVAAGN